MSSGRLITGDETLAAADKTSPDNAASLRSFFSRRDKQTTVELLSRIPQDGPALSFLSRLTAAR